MVHLAALATVLVACGHPVKPVPHVVADAAPQPDAMTVTPNLTWTIEPGRVGPAEVGKPMPEVLRPEHYVARMIADGQPIDAFTFSDDPPLMVIVDGPFTAAHADATGASEKFRAQAIAAVPSAAVTRVLVTGAGPKTAAGAGVGSTFADLTNAYPDVKLSPLPETLGRDTCAAHSKSLPGVAFIFETCAKAKQGAAVVRVDVAAP